MYRMFQLVIGNASFSLLCNFQMMVQSFCIGVENGPNYNFTEDWELQRMYIIYTQIVNNTIIMRKKQEQEYFSAVVPTIASQIVSSTSLEWSYRIGLGNWKCS